MLARPHNKSSIKILPRVRGNTKKLYVKKSIRIEIHMSVGVCIRQL